MTNAEFKAWRKRLGLSRSAAAEALGLSPDALANYEAGKRRDSGAEVTIPRYIALACEALEAKAG